MATATLAHARTPVGKDSLTLRLPPDWDAIQRVWDPCREYFAQRGLDDDTVYGLCMVTQELLENAVKYGVFDEGREHIQLALSGSSEAVTIEVHSPLDGESARLRRLDSMIQWIRGFQSPFEAYVGRLKEVAARPFDNGESGLGLVRMAYEGQCILDFYTDGASVLAMSAVYQPQAGAAGGTHGCA